ncbi:hypothetical protein [Corynebacterium sp. NML140438]|uniref:hypothetical protein n=1 Tax=Corynebacterium sp. NML140438 TaxID=1906334 RepID=UPI0011604785|nr:hypothetical protein [Corynebacterium sp. NML140438]
MVRGVAAAWFFAAIGAMVTNIAPIDKSSNMSPGEARAASTHHRLRADLPAKVPAILGRTTPTRHRWLRKVA